MTTALTAGSVPPFYREVYDLLCPNPQDSNIDREVFVKLLIKSGLPSQVLSAIWDHLDTNKGRLTRQGLYKALALVAFAQQGKQVNDKLLENFAGAELPKPSLGDLTDLWQLCQKLQRNRNPMKLGMTYHQICHLDMVHVNVVPEKKGFLLKHVEYQVKSETFKLIVRRRFSDFVALHELLLSQYPYRLIPRLPPKKMVGADSVFIEERRKALCRWLTIVARHPTLRSDPMIRFFFTFTGDDMQQNLRRQYRKIPDEFVTSERAAQAEELVSIESQTEFPSSKEQIRLLYAGIGKLKRIADNMVLRSQGYAADMHDLCEQLTILSNESQNPSTWATGGNEVWSNMKKGFRVIAKEFNLLSKKAAEQASRETQGVCEKLNLLLDVLCAHRELCDRYERGVNIDHDKAMAKLIAMKKKRIHGVSRDPESDVPEVLQSRILNQESVITNLTKRNSYALHCIHLETQLVHAHLEILASVMNTLVTVEVKGHAELSEVWNQVRPTIEKCLPENNGKSSSSWSV